MEPKLKFDLSQAPWQQCECGGMTFTEGFIFKRVSALLSPDGNERHVPITVFTCNTCSKIPKFVHEKLFEDFPEELKAQTENRMIPSK